MVPKAPTWTGEKPKDLPTDSQIDSDLVHHLERLSLVDFRDQEGVERLEAAVQFADQLRLIRTEGVQPMVTVLEDWPLYLREDAVTEGSCQRDILSNAARVEEDYFIAPPGNIPLAQEKKYGKKS